MDQPAESKPSIETQQPAPAQAQPPQPSAQTPQPSTPPVVEASQTATASQSATASQPAPATTPAAAEEKEADERTILVVDDNPNNRELIIDVLQRLKSHKLKFVQAKDGIQALEVATSDKPDVILLDIEMPNMDGFEVCEKIRANADLAKSQIIVITAKAEKADKAQAATVGANQYIVKPYDIMTLRKCVVSALEGTPSDCSIKV